MTKLSHRAAREVGSTFTNWKAPKVPVSAPLMVQVPPALVPVRVSPVPVADETLDASEAAGGLGRNSLQVDVGRTRRKPL